MFERLVGSVDDEIAHRAFSINLAEVTPQQVVEPVRQNIEINQPESEVGEKPKKNKEKRIMNNDGSESKKLGRNDPCPCGSGKKWKKCHYPNIP